MSFNRNSFFQSLSKENLAIIFLFAMLKLAKSARAQHSEQNLSQAEKAAIFTATFAFIGLSIALVVIGVCCCRKKEESDEEANLVEAAQRPH